MNSLTFFHFAFEDVDRKRVENFALDRAPQRARPVNGIVTCAREQLFGRVGKLQRDLLLLEPFRQTFQLDLDDLFQIILAQSIEDDDLVDVRVLATVEPDIRLGPRAHYKDHK